MDIKDFITKFNETLEIEDDSAVCENTIFRELDIWDSLAALSTISMVDDEYGITLTNKELRSVTSIKELFDLIQSMKK